MTGWSGGYVADIDYLPWFFPPQAPAHLGLALTIAGVEHAMAQHEFAFCDLGCGMGITVGAIAAANPRARVYGVDFSPGQIATARALAEEAGLTNLTYLEADFADLAAAPPADMPLFDCVSMHGVWAWVSDETRAALVRFLARQVKPGGVVHVGYNALPGWQDMFGLRRFLAEVAAGLPGRSDQRIEAALELARELNAAGAPHLKRSAMVQRVLDRARTMPSVYLAHEYLNENWRPMFHNEVAAALGEAKLTYAASGDLAENFSDLCLDAAQRALLERLPSQAARETARDLCLERIFRHDIFVRGPRRLTNGARSALLAGAMLIGSRPGEDPTFQVDVPAGKATMSEAAYGPIFAALAERPRRVGELVMLTREAGHPTSAAEIVAMLLISNQAHYVPFPDAAPSVPGQRWAAALARRFAFGDFATPLALPSPRLGNGIGAHPPEMQVHAALVSGCAPEAGMVADWILGEVRRRGEAIIENGVELGPDEARSRVGATAAKVIEDRLPLWRKLAIV